MTVRAPRAEFILNARPGPLDFVASRDTGLVGVLRGKIPPE